MPLRIEVGPRDIKNGENGCIVPRNNLKKEIHKIDPENNYTGNKMILDDITEKMADKSWESMNNNIRSVKTDG